jgi:hypothetical protein
MLHLIWTQTPTKVLELCYCLRTTMLLQMEEKRTGRLPVTRVPDIRRALALRQDGVVSRITHTQRHTKSI